jgi:Protein of unknown function (DUF2380)
MSHLTKLLVFLGLVALPASAAAVPRAAVFDFELIDTSLQGEMQGTSEAEKARLAQMAPRLRQIFADLGIYEVVDIAPVAEQARNSNLQACGFCDSMMAKKIGADLAVTGTVQKVSNLILNINLYVRDVQNNKLVNIGSVDIRGNTDDSWFHGLRYLIKNRMYKQK